MQKNLILFFFLLCTTSLWSQTKQLSSDPTKWTMEEIKRFSAMTPGGQEVFKKQILQQAEGQLKQKAEAANMTIDETLLPTTELKPPVPDVKRLATIPANPPTRQQLLQDVSKMELALKTTVGTTAVQKVETFVADKSVKEIQAAAIGGWYDENPQSALLLSMKAVTREPADIQGWNNFASMLNMTGLEERSIPILQYCLQELPNNAMLLNNMGQAFMGLGDMSKAKQYFNQCLGIDELHPEANRSMALISLFGKDMAGALKYLEKEMLVANRKTSLAYLVKSGQRDKINLAALRKRKMNLDGVDNRDFFSEISLEKFKIPDPPSSSKLSMAWRKENEALFKSIADEMFFWMKASQFTEEETKQEGKKYFGRYHDLVDELIIDLDKLYGHLLAYITEDDLGFLNQMHYDYMAKDKVIECPDSRGMSVEAYNTICCNLKTPPIDELMNKYNAFIQPKIRQAQSNYKQYINGLISVVQLDPSLSNKKLVYAAVGQYFAWLQGAIGAYLIKEPYMNCYGKQLSDDELKGAIESARNINLQCPSWLKIDVSLKVAKLKADCNGFNVEADVYKLINVGLEKKFKTGTSTLYVGAGLKGSFKGVASGSIKQQFYVVFDQNNEFADLGMRGGASGDLASGMIGAEFGYDFSLNSGFSAQGKVESKWINNWQKAMNYVSK